jgi:hypothetical protein
MHDMQRAIIKAVALATDDEMLGKDCICAAPHMPRVDCYLEPWAAKAFRELRERLDREGMED